MEENGTLDVMWSAYRTYHNVSQSLLFYLLSTTQAFKTGQLTVANFVDFESVFDAVWTEGTNFTLHEAGICANMLLYNTSFLG